MNDARHPRIGDLIIKTLGTDKHYGVVWDIRLDKWGHQRSVLIEWTNGTPTDYKERWGYAGVNIHNLREEYEVIRDGVSVK